MSDARIVKKRFRRREIVFTSADEQAFSIVLRETFPEMRFLDHVESKVSDYFAANPRRKTMPTLPYVDDLSEVSVGWRTGWLEPEGWKPEFAPIGFNGQRKLANPPRCAFRYFDAKRRILTNDYTKLTAFRMKDKPLPQNKVRMPTTIHVAFLPFDEDAKKFAAKVMRAVSKVAVNTLIRVDPITGYSRMPPARDRNIWVGYDALAWCRENSRNFVDLNLRPGDEAEERHKLPKDDPGYYTLKEASERLRASFAPYKLSSRQSVKKQTKGKTVDKKK